ncbi:MAG: hypothetical protein V5A43_05035 [Haloarculaceae archaeon]
MVDLPWGGNDDADSGDSAEPDHADALVVCDFQDGTLAVYEDEVAIERSKRSKFEDVRIPYDRVVGAEYEKGITIGYLQIELAGVEPDRGGWFSDPVNENTLHFGRGSRDCAKEARDEILARATG